MRTVHKFRLEDDECVVVPRVARPVLVGAQGGDLCVWMEVDTEQPLVRRLFGVFGTGQSVPPDAIHVGSCQVPPYDVWHVYELPVPGAGKEG